MIAAHERAQLVDVRIPPAHFADFAAHRHRHVPRLVLPDERGEIGGERGVHLLLFGERWFLEVDER